MQPGSSLQKAAAVENAHPWLQVLVSVATPPLGLTEQGRLHSSPTGTGQPPGTCHGQNGARAKDRGWEIIRELPAGCWEERDARAASASQDNRSAGCAADFIPGPTLGG